VRWEYPASFIADLVLKRVRVKDQVWRPLRLVIVTPQGAETPVATGARDELVRLCAALREGLGLPDDPLDARRYPPALSARRAGVTRTFLRRGVQIVVPPRGNWLALVVAAPVIAVQTVITGAALSARGSWLDALLQWDAWILLRVVAITAIALVMLWAALRQLRRTTTLRIADRRLSLIETGLIQPCHEDWPLSAISTVRAAPCHDDPRLATLEILFRDGRDPIPALGGLPLEEVRWVAANLRVAIDLTELGTQRLAATDIGFG
jgi:hypothetical protein